MNPAELTAEEAWAVCDAIADSWGEGQATELAIVVFHRLRNHFKIEDFGWIPE